jgi:2-C-methyl-D-erythritol 4-phosphate cytidylyltransferase
MAVILKAEEKGNAILAVRAKDTVRMVRNNISEGILDREKIYLVQTPQVFDLKILNEVYEKSKIINFVGTDDAMLLEHYGYEIYIVEGGYQNFKITSSFDFKVAQYLADFENLEDLF